MGPGTARDQPPSVLCRLSIRVSARNGFLSKQKRPLAVASAFSPGSLTAVNMMTGNGEARDASNRLSSNPLMPVMTGVELCTWSIEAGHRIPTILVTAYPDEATRARALNDGIVCYLLKPFDDNDLKDCVRRAVEGGKPAPREFMNPSFLPAR